MRRLTIKSRRWSFAADDTPIRISDRFRPIVTVEPLRDSIGLLLATPFLSFARTPLIVCPGFFGRYLPGG
jgi:hypothetical protein